MAVGAAAIAENLDRDELILQEREKLRKLQEEWRNKLRQAEIDISIERARIARQRVEIEDKVSAYDSVRAQHKADDSASNPGNQPKQPTRGRWLARLGLKDDGGLDRIQRVGNFRTAIDSKVRGRHNGGWLHLSALDRMQACSSAEASLRYSWTAQSRFDELTRFSGN